MCRKLLKGLLLTGLAAAATAAAQLLATSGTSVNWQTVAFVSAIVGGVAIVNALSKYFTAQGDALLADVTAQVAHTLAGLTPHLPIVNSAASAPTAPMPAALATVPSVP